MRMITSAHEYERTRRQLVRWQAMKRRIDGMIENFGVEDPEIITSVLESQISGFERAVSEYDQRSNLKRDDCMKSLEILPQHLIRARLKLGWTQAQLAKRIGVSNQVMNKYERSNYLQVRLGRVMQVAKILDSALDGE